MEHRLTQNWTRISADKTKKSAPISVHLRPKEYAPTLHLGMVEQLRDFIGDWVLSINSAYATESLITNHFNF